MALLVVSTDWLEVSGFVVEGGLIVLVTDSSLLATVED